MEAVFIRSIGQPKPTNLFVENKLTCLADGLGGCRTVTECMTNRLEFLKTVATGTLLNAWWVVRGCRVVVECKMIGHSTAEWLLAHDRWWWFALHFLIRWVGLPGKFCRITWSVGSNQGVPGLIWDGLAMYRAS